MKMLNPNLISRDDFVNGGEVDVTSGWYLSNRPAAERGRMSYRWNHEKDECELYVHWYRSGTDIVLAHGSIARCVDERNRLIRQRAQYDRLYSSWDDDIAG